MTTAEKAQPGAPAARGRARWASAWALLPWAFLPAVAAYLAVLAARFGSVLHVASWNADNANMLNLSKELTAMPEGAVVDMGNAPLTAVLWMNSALGRLPGAADWMQAVPAVLTCAAVAFVAWSVWRATGDRWAAAATAGLLVCLGPLALEIATSFATHGATWLVTAALGAYAVRLACGGRRAVTLALSAAAGALAGAVVASDPLVLSVALLPLAVTVGADAWRRRGLGASRAPVAVFAATLAAMYAGTRAGAGAAGIEANLPSATLATVEQMWSNMLQAVENAMTLMGPAPFGEEVGAWEVLRLAAGLAGLAGAVLAVAALRRWWPDVASRRARPDEPGGLRALETYWGLSVAVSLVFFATSPLAFDVGSSSGRYTLNLLFASAVALPLWLRRRGRRGVLAGAAVVVLAGAVGVHGLGGVADDRRALDRSDLVVNAPAAVRAAAELGATRGYAAYWDASPLTWHTGTRVLPVANCSRAGVPTLCIAPTAVPGHLLAPRPDERSFVLINHAFPGSIQDPSLEGFGPWLERRVIGGVYLLVYPYDVGTRFGPAGE